MKKKNIIIIIVSIIIVISSFLLAICLLNNKEENLKEESIYGTVLKSKNGCIVIKTIDGEEVEVDSNVKLKSGTLVNVTYDKNKKPVIDVILDKENFDELIVDVYETTDDITTTTTTTTVAPTTTSKKSTTSNLGNTTTTTTKVIKTTTTTTTQAVSKENQIINYAQTAYNEVENGNVTDKKTLKDRTIEFIDFIFYDQPIKGVYFKDLTGGAKAKVIYYTLLLDNKIDSLIPNYKENLSEKYQSIKGKLVAKYLEITASVCENNKDTCDILKTDFEIVKKGLNISWNFLKDAFSYASNKTVSSLTNWYKIWSGKE